MGNAGATHSSAATNVNDNRFVDDMGNLVNNQQYSDIELEIDEKIVYGHKAILATRSPYMARLFNSNQNAKTIKVPTLTFDDVKTVLHFLYTNRLPIGVDTSRLVTMCKASAMLEVPDLKTAAIGDLRQSMKCDNVVSIFTQAKDDALLGDVKRICVTFMANNLKEMSNKPNNFRFDSLSQLDIMEVLQAALLTQDQRDTNTSKEATTPKHVVPLQD